MHRLVTHGALIFSGIFGALVCVASAGVLIGPAAFFIVVGLLGLLVLWSCVADRLPPQ
jgi:hypothetical protein